MHDIREAFTYGFFVALIVTLAIWLMCAWMTEHNKVAAGYLTLHNTIYSVKPFDTLDKPGDSK